MRECWLFCFIFMSSFIYAQQEKKTIVFLGDSLTAGYGLAEEDAYPAQFQNFLNKDGLNWNVVNAGVSGDTTKGGLERLDWIMKSHPTLVFVALGANDGLRGLDLKFTRKNLEVIIQQLKKSGIDVILTGVQIPSNYGTAYTKQFKTIFPQLAEKHKIPLLPFLLEGVAMHPDLNLADGIHPNAKGHQIIAYHVYKFLKPILKKHDSY